MDENPDRSADELIDWLCWMWAIEGERFYPPDETAEECIEALEINEDYGKGVEHGEHFRAINTAQERFQDLQNLGFEPKARVERHIEETDLDLNEIDWTWLQA